MGGIGTTELILIFAVALIIFGPSKLPELGKMAGRAIGSFKRYVNSFEAELEAEEKVKQDAKVKEEEIAKQEVKAEQNSAEAAKTTTGETKI